MADLISLGEGLKEAVGKFVARLEAHPTDVVSLDQHLADILENLYDRLFAVTTTAESDEEDDVYIPKADLERKMAEMQFSSRVNWNVVAKLLIRCSFPKFLSRWTRHLFSSCLGRSDQKTLENDLRTLKKVMCVFNQSLEHSMFLRDVVLSRESDVEMDSSDDLANFSKFHFHSLLQSLPLLLMTVCGKLVPCSNNFVDQEKFALLSAACRASKVLRIDASLLAEKLVDCIHILVTCPKRERIKSFIQYNSNFLSVVKKIVVGGGMLSKNVVVAIKLIRIYLLLKPQEMLDFGCKGLSAETIILKQLIGLMNKFDDDGETEKLQAAMGCVNRIAVVKENVPFLAAQNVHGIYEKILKKSEVNAETVCLALNGLIKMTFEEKTKQEIVKIFEDPNWMKLKEGPLADVFVDEKVKKLERLILFQMGKTEMFEDFALQSNMMNEIEKNRFRRQKSVEELFEKEGKYVNDMANVVEKYKPKVEEIRNMEAEAEVAMNLKSGPDTSAKLILDVIDLTTPILTLHRDNINPVIRWCYEHRQNTYFLPVATELLKVFTNTKQVMKNAYKKYVLKCTEASQKVQDNLGIYERMRKELEAENPGLNVTELHLCIDLPWKRLMHYKMFIENIRKSTMNLQEHQAVAKLDELLGIAQEIPDFVNMFMHVKNITEKKESWGEIRHRDDLWVSESDKSVGDIKQQLDKLRTKMKGFVFQHALVFCELFDADNLGLDVIANSAPLEVKHVVFDKKLVYRLEDQSNLMFVLEGTEESNQTTLWVETPDKNRWKVWTEVLREMEEEKEYLLATIMAPTKKSPRIGPSRRSNNTFFQPSNQSELGRFDFEENPMTEEDTLHLLRLVTPKLEAVIFSEEHSLPTAMFLRDRLASRGRSVDLMYRRETVFSYDEVARKISDANLFIGAFRNKVHHTELRSFLHFALSNKKHILLINSDRNIRIEGWVNNFVQNHSADLLPQSPMEIGDLMEAERRAPEICGIVQRCGRVDGGTDERLAALRDKQKMAERWSKGTVVEWMTSHGFHPHVVNFLKDCDGKTILRIANCLKKDHEEFVPTLNEIHGAGSETGSGTGNGVGVSISVPLFILNHKRHFLDLILPPPVKPKPRGQSLRKSSTPPTQTPPTTPTTTTPPHSALSLDRIPDIIIEAPSQSS